jgi:hypothetical protein
VRAALLHAGGVFWRSGLSKASGKGLAAYCRARMRWRAIRRESVEYQQRPLTCVWGRPDVRRWTTRP